MVGGWRCLPYWQGVRPCLLFLLPLAACGSPPRATPPASRPAATAAGAPSRPAWVARKVVPDAVAVPGGRLHTVKPGETGIAIARAYGVGWDKVVALNGLKPPYVLEVGDRLRLPSAREIAAMSLEDRAAAFDLRIDDIITGGEPAVRGARAVPPPVTRTPGFARSRPPAAIAPLPALSGDVPRFAWPVEGRIVSGYGPKPGGRFNDGVNLKASQGQAVRAAADGVVAYAGDAIPGFGNLVLVKHAGGWVSAYGHNDALLVARGKRVRQGDVIARAGSTGAVTDPQVHFELRRGRTPVDPVRIIGGR